MKYNKMLKKAGAALTAAAMLSTMGFTAFAADVMDGNQMVTGNGLDITAVTASYTGEEGNKTYTVDISYAATGMTNDAQVTVLGYVYEKNGTVTDVPAMNGDNSIYAVNQDAHSAYNGKITVKLSQQGAKGLGDATNLVVKVGSDATGVTTAQAVLIDLANAQEIVAPFIAASVETPEAVTVPYGASKADLDDELPATVTVNGTRDGATTTEQASVVWDTSSIDTVTSNVTINGTVTKPDDWQLAEGVTALTTTVDVNWTALTTGALEAVDGIEVSVDADATAIANRIRTVTIKSGDVTDTYDVTAAMVTGFDTSAEGSTAATITVSGESKNKRFNLASDVTTTVAITVVEGTTVLYGDVNNDGRVTALDNMYLGRHLAHWSGYESLPSEANSDVNADGRITALDNMCLGRHLAHWSGYESLPYQK